MDHAAANHARSEQYQRAMRVDCKSFRAFLEFIALSILAAHANAHLHKHALAAPPRSARCVWCKNLRHANPRLRPLYRQSRVSRGPRGRRFSKWILRWLTALFHWNVVARVVAKINLARTRDFLFWVEEH